MNINLELAKCQEAIDQLSQAHKTLVTLENPEGITNPYPLKVQSLINDLQGCMITLMDMKNENI